MPGATDPPADRWIPHSARGVLDETARRAHNAAFEGAELARFADFFANVLPQPLNPEQRAAIVVDEDATLVVAAAGSGKTTLLLGKIAYLRMRGLARPEEIALLAFNQSVRTEIRQRLAASCPGVAVHTFHSLGLDILRRTSAGAGRLSGMAADASRLRAFLLEATLDLAGREPGLMAEWLAAYFRPLRHRGDFARARDHSAWLRRHPPLTLLGSRVANEPLREVADRLALAGIRHLTDKVLPSLPGLPPYRPQLWLPDARVVIDLPDAGGDSQRLGKREPGWGARLVQEPLTRLACLRHRLRRVRVARATDLQRRGCLGETLAAALARHGLDLRPRAIRALASRPAMAARLEDTADLLATCVTLHKGSATDLPGSREGCASPPPAGLRQPESPDARRQATFDAIFRQALAAYETRLAVCREIDFNDMITRAIEVLDRGAARVPFRYLLVDEFQDISAGRAALIKALRRSRPDMRLLAVGDDWQSIYRFAGSDVSLMTGFEQHFGLTETRFLRQTFRFDRSLERVASAFVLRNPAQIRKQVEAREPDDHVPPVVLWVPSEGAAGDPLPAIAEDLFGAPAVAAPACPEVLILARYRAVLAQVRLEGLTTRHPQARWRCSTIHRAKGATADYVVLLGVCGGRQPFPAERADDPLLAGFLGVAETFAHAEERRLLYVALTRARHRVYVVGDGRRPSPFFEELRTHGKDVSLRGMAE